MIELAFTIEIERPVEEVFAYLTDPSKLPEWDPRIVDVEQLTDGPMRVGTRFRETRTMLGRKVSQVVEVTEYDPPRLFTLRIEEGPIGLDARNVLEAVDGKTRLRFEGSGKLRGAARVAQPIAAALLKRQMQAHYERVREQLEAR